MKTQFSLKYIFAYLNWSTGKIGKYWNREGGFFIQKSSKNINEIESNGTYLLSFILRLLFK